MSLVMKKISYSIALRFPLFGVDVSKELSESELRQFHSELKRLEAVLGEQLGLFSSVLAAPSWRSQTAKENMAKVLEYAKGKRLFKTSDVVTDMGISRNVVYPALARLVNDKKLTRLRLRPGGAFGYKLGKQDASIPEVEVENDETRRFREDAKRLDAVEAKARLDSR